jgi:hypothetical protein
MIESLEGRALLSVYLVDSLGDAGAGEGPIGDLRYAIDQADQSKGDSTILFFPTLHGQTIALTQGSLSINKPSGTLTIFGLGPNGLTISGEGLSQVFTISSTSKVSMSGLTITDGEGSDGGAIQNDGTLKIKDCTITDSIAIGEGGGGISNSTSGRMTISYSTISGNVAFNSAGGGIDNAGTMTITNSTISGNATHVGNGGGIDNSGHMSLGNSTISGNEAVARNGGGVNNSAVLTMTDDTVNNNTAAISGGGITNQGAFGGTMVLDNTIVFGNLSSDDPFTDDVADTGDVAGTDLSGSNDLVGVGDLGALTNTLVGVNPLLGPLQNNGGPTMTEALFSGSPAIGTGDPALVPKGVTTDQRGEPYIRIVDGQLDIGAFEVQAPRSESSVSRTPVPAPVSSPDVIIGLTIVPPIGNSHSSTAGGGTGDGV